MILIIHDVMKYDFIEKMGISSACPTFDVSIKYNSTIQLECELSIECHYVGYSDGTVINKISINKFKSDGNINDCVDSITHSLKNALKGTILDTFYDDIIGHILDYEPPHGI